MVVFIIMMKLVDSNHHHHYHEHNKNGNGDDDTMTIMMREQITLLWMKWREHFENWS